MSLAVLVPVLNRPHRVQPTIDAFNNTVPGARVLFIADLDDVAERDALIEADADYIAPGGNYAEKIRAGVDATDEALIFTAADDLDPKSGWFQIATFYLGRGCEVVGVNDLCSDRVQAGEHATHFLMTRAYAETPTIDDRPGPFYDGYAHWYCDDELVGTAKHRDVISFATESHVEHLHPMNGKAPDDETYQRGRAQRRLDRRLFNKRRHLWT